jgi:hypothetical protein
MVRNAVNRFCGWVIVATMAMLMLALPHAVAAQSSSAADCELDPVTLPLFDATPAAEIPGAIATPASPDATGQPASPEDTEIYRTALDALVACTNTGEPEYAYAIFTERYLASLFVDPDRFYQPAFERMIAQGDLDIGDSEPLTVENIDHVMVLADGRLSGRVVTTSAGISWTDILILQQVGDDWLIDDVIPVSR